MFNLCMRPIRVYLNFSFSPSSRWRNAPYFMFKLCILFAFLLSGQIVMSDIPKLREISESQKNMKSSCFQREFMDKVLDIAKSNPRNMQKEVVSFIQEFSHQVSQMRKGKDRELRPIYVSSLGDFELAMACFLKEKKISSLFGIIHSPTIPTAVSMIGEISNKLIDHSLQDDDRCHYILLKHSEVIRYYLDKQGILIAAYPFQGKLKRTDEQLKVFDSLKKKHPNTLIDLPLKCSQIDNELIGATYLFKTKENHWFAFSFNGLQSYSPKDGQVWGMWFGPLHDPIIFERVQTIFSFLHQHQDRDLTTFLK